MLSVKYSPNVAVTIKIIIIVTIIIIVIIVIMTVLVIIICPGRTQSGEDVD